MRKVLKPAGYHGHGKRSKYFEGWYVKLVDAHQDARLAVIPGVFLATEENGPHEAFVQVLDGRTGRSWYIPYPMSEFTADPEHFAVQVGPNRFSTGGVRLDLPEVGLSGTVEFGRPLDPWPVSPRSPGAMGWYAWMPFMECYHGVVSFRHDLAGGLNLDGEHLDFSGGKGYIEKDWGQAFPSGYVWMHSNHFDDPSVSLMASVAIIPWLRGQFQGLLVGLRHGDTLHRFASYTGAKVQDLRIDDEHVWLGIRGRDGSGLQIKATRPGGAFLHAPIRTQMHKRVEETLDSTIALRLTDANGRVLLDDTGTSAGLEVHGDTARLIRMGAG
ncbi:MAG TPA: tocopherol cyclase family protein [Actinomycetota bacterium]|nr:tocopherol cyclase family protein [Actinomycetota bacterium]